MGSWAVSGDCVETGRPLGRKYAHAIGIDYIDVSDDEDQDVQEPQDSYFDVTTEPQDSYFDVGGSA